MELELLTALAQGGVSIVLIWLVWDMRREAREDRKQIWVLLTWLIQNSALEGSPPLPEIIIPTT